MELADIVKMGYVIQNFLEEVNMKNAKPKNLMPILIEKGFFKKDQRDGLPLRNELRNLESQELLYLIPQVKAEKKNINTSWVFNPVEF